MTIVEGDDEKEVTEVTVEMTKKEGPVDQHAKIV